VKVDAGQMQRICAALEACFESDGEQCRSNLENLERPLLSALYTAAIRLGVEADGVCRLIDSKNPERS
jgi:hypothetical protein